MLLRLLPEQVARYWEEVFKGPIQSTLPPIAGESEDKMNNVLESILAGGLVVWLSYTKTDMIKVSGFIVTQLVADDPSKTLAILIYSIYSPNGFSEREWVEGFRAFGDYAHSMQCNRIVGYSNVEAVLKRVEQFGGDTSYRFLSIPV